MRSPFLAFTMVILVAAGVFSASAFNYARLEPRTSSVVVASDQNAYVAVEVADSSYGCFVTYDSGKIHLTFDNECAGGQGINAYSTYYFHDVLKVTNKGTKAISTLYLNLSSATLVSMATAIGEDVMHVDSTYQDKWELTTNLAAGDTWYIGFKIDASATGNSTISRTLDIHARVTI